MPETKSKTTLSVNARQGKKETQENLNKFLKDLNVPFEVVMGYHCFVYKNKHHRVKSILEAKKSMNLYI